MKKILSKLLVIVMLFSIISSSIKIDVQAAIDTISNSINNYDKTVQSTSADENNGSRCGIDNLGVDNLLDQVPKKYKSYSLPNAENSLSLSECNNIRPIVIYIKFSDDETKYFTTNKINEIKDSLIGSGYSLNTYLNLISYGKCSVDPIFTYDKNSCIYTPAHKSGYYKKYKAGTNEEGYKTDDEKINRRDELFNGAIRECTKNIDFSNVDLDKNGDGNIDSIIFYNSSFDDYREVLYSENWAIWNDQPEIVDKSGVAKKVYNYINVDKNSLNGWGKTLITHEFSHNIGFPDMYPYPENTSVFKQPCGKYTMMDSNAGYPAVAERIKYGKWFTYSCIPSISQEGTYSLKDVSNNPNSNTIAYKIEVPNSNEYFMVEYRNKNANVVENLIPESGILVYRVDPSKNGNGSFDPEIYVLRNDGQTADEGVLTGASGRKSHNLVLTSGEDTGYSVEYVSKNGSDAKFKLVCNSGVKYSTIIQNNSNFEGFSRNGQLSGTEGQGKRIDGIKMDTYAPNGGIMYRAYIHNVGWTNWASSYKEIKGNGNDIESIQVKLTGSLSNNYDVYYRTHNRYYGWLGWTSNGKVAGTYNNGSAIEGIQVQLVKKGTTVNGVTNDTNAAYKSEEIDFSASMNTNYIIKVGTTVNVTAKSVKNTIDGCKYKYDILYTKDDSICSTSGWISSSNYSYNFNNKGMYWIRVSIKDNATGVIKTKTFFRMYVCELHGTVNKSTINEGESITVTPKYVGDMTLSGVGIKVNDEYVLTPGNYLTDGQSYNVTMDKNLKPSNKITIVYQLTKDAEDILEENFYVNANLKKQVTFKDYNGTVLKTETVSYGGSATAPSNPTRTGYTFAGWDKSYTNITQDTVVTAKYNINKYTVTFKDYNGTVLKTQTVSYGGSATAPSNPTRTGYVFSYWNGRYENVTSNETVTAVYNRDVKITSIDINGGKPVVAGQEAYIKVNTNYSSGLNYTIEVHSIAGKITLANRSNSNIVKWVPTEYYAGTYCSLEIAVADTLSQAYVSKTSGFSVVNVTNNQTTIYYKGYDNAHIHYQIGNGAWTTKPVKMNSSSDVDGYNYAITIDLGDAKQLTACFNNGSNGWDSNNGNNYKFGVGYYTYSNGVITKIDKPTKQLKIDSITSQLGSSYVSGNQNIFTAQVSNATGKVQYQFEYKNKTTGVSGVLRNYSEYNKLATYLGTPGQYTLTVYVKDEAGNTDSKTLDFRIEEYKNLEIKSVTSSLGDTFQKGKTTQLTINVTGGMGNNYYSLEVNGQSILNASSSNSVSWTPTEAGKYEITAYAREAQGGSTSYTKTITVEDKVSNQTTIYYKGYDNAHIHYQIGNGAWTTKPVKMNSSSDVAGYNYAMTIDLGDATQLTACFNDGSNGWDSNNGNNYKFGVGYYTYSNGVITKINKPTKQLKIDSITSKLGSSYVSGNQNIFTAKVSNASGKVQYQFEYKNKTTGVSGVLRNYSEYNTLATYLGTPGQYTLTVYVKDESGNTDSKTLDFTIEEYKNLEIKSVTSSLGDTFQKGKTTQLTINATGGMGNNYYSIEVNGQSILNASSSNSVSWTPTEAGKYEITAYAREAQGGSTSYTKTITVEDKVSNQTTIYYKGYDNAHIHYRIGNGAWTTKPVKMNSSSDVAGYNYAMTIDLGDATQLTACFNDGSNGWDSNNGNNYKFGVGYYTYSNGVITKIDKPSSELKINSITCSSGSTIKMGSTVNLTVNASGGEGPYTYYLYYSAYGSGRANYRLNGTTTNTATFTPDYPRETTLYAEVVDSTGKKVTYSQTFDVREKTSNLTTIYYRGYDNAHIHYQIGNGAWTTKPVKMELNSDVAGYNYAITIDLGDAEQLTACFNNGSNGWDSNNGNNYKFGVGKYTYSNGVITKIN